MHFCAALVVLRCRIHWTSLPLLCLWGRHIGADSLDIIVATVEVLPGPEEDRQINRQHVEGIHEKIGLCILMFRLRQIKFKLMAKLEELEAISNRAVGLPDRWLTAVQSKGEPLAARL